MKKYALEFIVIRPLCLQVGNGPKNHAARV